jgi:hypothetical protein
MSNNAQFCSHAPLRAHDLSGCGQGYRLDLRQQREDQKHHRHRPPKLVNNKHPHDMRFNADPAAALAQGDVVTPNFKSAFISCTNYRD